MSLSSVDLEFNDSQMSAIIGQNGEGKSAILDAIAFAITNHKKGESYKDYVKIGTDKAVVYLEALLKGKPIIYDITIKAGKNATVNREVNYDGKTYFNSEYAQFMDTYELNDVENLIFMFQNSNDLIECKPKERATILKKIFDFQFPEEIKELENRQDNEKRLSIEYDTLIRELNNRTFEILPQMRGIPEEGIVEMENRVAEIDDLLSKIGIANEAEIERCDNDISSLQRTISSSKSNMESDRITLARLETQLKSFTEKLDSMDEIQIKQDIDNLNKAIESHDIEYKNKQDSYVVLNKELGVIKFQLSELQKQLEISKTGVCHACGQPIEESHIRKLEEEVNKTTESKTDKEKALHDLGYDPNDSEGRKLRNELKYHTERLAEYENLINSKATSEDRIKSTKALMEEREITLKELDSKMVLLQEKRKELSEAVKLVETRNALNTEKKDTQRRIKESRETNARNIERALANKRTEEAMRERDAEVNEFIEKANNVSLNLVRIKQEIDIFENKFPNFIVLQACKYLEDVINDTVQKVFPYCKVALKTDRSGVNFVYTSESSSEEWLPVSMASGAQRTVLGLAYFLALAKLSGTTCVFLDEIDAACSAENSEIIYDFIAEVNYFPQLFFISHRQEAREAVKERNGNLVTYRVMQGTVFEES